MLSSGCDEDGGVTMFLDGNKYSCPSEAYCSVVMNDSVVYYNFTGVNGSVVWRLDYA